MSYSSRVSLGARGHREPCQVRQAGSSRRWQPLQCPRRPGLAAQGRRRRGQHDRQRSWRCQRSRGWTWLRMLLCRKGEGKKKRRWMDDGMGGTRGDDEERERAGQRDGAKERERERELLLRVGWCCARRNRPRQQARSSSRSSGLTGTSSLQSSLFHCAPSQVLARFRPSALPDWRITARFLPACRHISDPRLHDSAKPPTMSASSNPPCFKTNIVTVSVIYPVSHRHTGMY